MAAQKSPVVVIRDLAIYNTCCHHCVGGPQQLQGTVEALLPNGDSMDYTLLELPPLDSGELSSPLPQQQQQLPFQAGAVKV